MNRGAYRVAAFLRPSTVFEPLQTKRHRDPKMESTPLYEEAELKQQLSLRSWIYRAEEQDGLNEVLLAIALDQLPDGLTFEIATSDQEVRERVTQFERLGIIEEVWPRQQQLRIHGIEGNRLEANIDREAIDD